MKKALILLAPGFEEVEALTPADYLSRAGVEVALCSIGGGKTVEGSHGIRVEAGITLSDAEGDWDCLVVPGGQPGTRNLAASAKVIALVRGQAASGRLLGAICAAPALVLGKAAGVLEGKRFTCFPGLEAEFDNGLHSTERVVREGNIITSRAAGTAGEFAIALIGALEGEEVAAKVAQAVLLAGA